MRGTYILIVAQYTYRLHTNGSFPGALHLHVWERKYVQKLYSPIHTASTVVAVILPSQAVLVSLPVQSIIGGSLSEPHTRELVRLYIYMYHDVTVRRSIYSNSLFKRDHLFPRFPLGSNSTQRLGTRLARALAVQ